MNQGEKCVYCKDTKYYYVILHLYIDQILTIGDNDQIIKSTKKMVNSRFDMKDMGPTSVIMKIKIPMIYNRLIVYHCHYADKILEKFNKHDSRISITSIHVNLTYLRIKVRVYLSLNILE